MTRPLAAAALAVLVLLGAGNGSVSSAATTRSLPVRPARPADDVGHGATRWAEEWRVLAFDPATHGFVAIYLVGGPIPVIEVLAQGPGGVLFSAGATLAYGLMPHSGPGVTIANKPDNAPPQPNSLSYRGGRYVVDLTWPARGRITISPRRAGVTVGPWRLGGEPIYRGGPPTYVPGWMRWSVPVAVGEASGWVEADGKRVTLRGWRVFHDHIWGHFRRSSSSWTHWDFAVVSPRPGEAWILNGLEPTDGGYQALPRDAKWEGVLVHATRGRLEYCQASVVRRGWDSRNLNVGGFGWDYWLPTFVRARCGVGRMAVQPRARPWPFFDAFSGGVLASSPLRGGNGWIEHAVPIFPNT